MHILSDGLLEGHDDTEKRLIRETDSQPDLFAPSATYEDLAQRAYEKRAREIAYLQEAESAIYQ
jgi:hypothetical protein